MTVSSVKNLNGETFSAVQDASLTDIVSSNSANWNEISAYQANSASYLQDTDLTIVDNKITEISGVPLSAGDELPSGVMNTSALEYNAVNEISGYSGSAFKDVALTDVVTANSGAWGGSALPISAGPGIDVQLVDDKLVFSAIPQTGIYNETVLFSGDATISNSTAVLTEPLTNFEKIKVYGHTDDGAAYPWSTEIPTFSGVSTIGVATNNNGWSKWFSLTVTDTTHIVPTNGYVITWGSTSTAYLNNWGITRVIGVNRTAGGE